MCNNKNDGKSNPKSEANLISRLFFWWLNPLFFYGRKHNLEQKDIYNILRNDTSEELGNQLEKYWNNEVEDCQITKKTPRLLKAIRKMFGSSFIPYSFHSVMYYVICRSIQPYLIGLLIWYFDPRSNISKTHAYLIVTGNALVVILQTFLGAHLKMDLMELGMRLRIATSSLIYRKILRLSTVSTNKVSGGVIANLLSNDVARFENFFEYLHILWIMPIQIFLFALLVWQNVGIASLAGLFFVILQTAWIQGFCGKTMGYIRLKIALRTDERVRLMNELISGIRVIKMYTWEGTFARFISDARKHELRLVRIRACLKSLNNAMFIVSERMCVYLTVMAYVLQGNNIYANQLYSISQYFHFVQAMVILYFPSAVVNLAESLTSINRIQEFLLLDENMSNMHEIPVSEENNISVQNVNASWIQNSITNTLEGVSFDIPLNQLFAIAGPVGSGKSSLLKLFLNELDATSGHVHIRGSLSYASQEPWLFHGTIRENILFGQDFDEKRYAEVTDVCGLTRDFRYLPSCDKTIVGDRGVTLSGGQCARISLARAVYKDADIYLMDDPFSALDVHVGKDIFKRCIEDYLKNKTRILITHHTYYLTKADKIILMENGRIKAQGTFNDFSVDEFTISNEPNTAEAKYLLMKKNLSVETIHSEHITVVKPDGEEPNETNEFIAKGNLPKSLYFEYFRAGAHYFILFIFFLFCIVAQACANAIDFWASYWVNQEENLIRKNDTRSSVPGFTLIGYIDVNTALIVYGSLLLASIVLVSTKNIIFCEITVKASKTLHNRMFNSLLNAPVSFFDRHPSGQILNRFSKDLGAVDETLPISILSFLQILFIAAGIMAHVLRIKWWTIFLIIILLYTYGKIRRMYMSTAQDLKRLEGVAKSPVLSYANSTLFGLLTIRSSQTQKMHIKEFDTLQDRHTSTYLMIIATTAAFCFWIEIVSLTFGTLLMYGFILVDKGDLYAGNVGLAVTQAWFLCVMTSYGLYQSAEMASQVVGVERILQYTKLDREDDQGLEKPSPYWPNKGKIEFDHVYLRYVEYGEPVLKNINIVIDAGEKVGIVGRTGAGKSSLISALFRISDFDGNIFIDSLDIKKIVLSHLRKEISIIPQNPILFSASLRDNLDPSHEFEDVLLWSALHDVEMNKTFISLDYNISHDGGNLSTGQKQLICFARAILNKNKILILDEATANVDPTTDAVIQKTIRNKFKGRTVIIIAHRLNTIMDCDKILVMNDGEVVEFDHPYILLQRKGGYFSKMLKKMEKEAAESLTNIAKEAYVELISVRNETEH